MGKQRSIIRLSGRMGNVIGYERNGGFFFRSAPEHVNQTLSTRRASKRFGRYSRKGKVIRHAFYPALDVRCDTTHINRLNKLLIEANGDLMAIKGFRFNEAAGIDRFFSRKPYLSSTGILQIPAQEICRHKGITALAVKVIAVRTDFGTQQVTGTDTVDLMIDTRQPFAGAAIPLYVPGKGTLMLTLQVTGILKDVPSANRQYLAADIIAVVPPPRPKRKKMLTDPQHPLSSTHPGLPPLSAQPPVNTVQLE